VSVPRLVSLLSAWSGWTHHPRGLAASGPPLIRRRRVQPPTTRPVCCDSGDHPQKDAEHENADASWYTLNRLAAVTDFFYVHPGGEVFGHGADPTPL
jgi:hypothetical protein